MSVPSRLLGGGLRRSQVSKQGVGWVLPLVACSPWRGRAGGGRGGSSQGSKAGRTLGGLGLQWKLR